MFLETMASPGLAMTDQVFFSHIHSIDITFILFCFCFNANCVVLYSILCPKLQLFHGNSMDGKATGSNSNVWRPLWLRRVVAGVPLP